MDPETWELTGRCDRCAAADGRETKAYVLSDKGDDQVREFCEECADKTRETQTLDEAKVKKEKGGTKKVEATETPADTPADDGGGEHSHR